MIPFGSDPYAHSISELKRFLPVIELPNSRIAYNQTISRWILKDLNGGNVEKTLFDEWTYVYQMLFVHMSKIMMFTEQPFTIQLFHVSRPAYDFDWELRLYADIMIFNGSGGKRFSIPNLSYGRDKDNTLKLHEWRCGYCNSPNAFINKNGDSITECQRCGATRPILLQEFLRDRQ